MVPTVPAPTIPAVPAPAVLSRTVLVVAAHPDDEVLGCGGTIARHAAGGDVVHLLFMTNGEDARGNVPAGHVEARRQAARAAAALLGAQPPVLLDFPDNRMDSLALLDVVQAVERQIAAVTPDVIYTHHGGDLNVDHRVVHQAVLTACRPQAWSPVQALYAFAVPSSSEWAGPGIGPAFQPTRFVDISGHQPAKRAALEAYASEMRPFPHSRSLEGVAALDCWTGAMVGMAAAEGFMVLRELARA